MAHQSDNADRLRLRTLRISSLDERPEPSAHVPEVWLFVLPFGNRIADSERISGWVEYLHRFAAGLHEQSVVGILTTPEDAAITWPQLAGKLRFQLWVAVKLADLQDISSTRLPQHHAALLVLTKYHAVLRHTKTRIGYSYCPACDKTTKDYGGKKHTYHEYGTLMSDVWRDIAYTPGQSADPIVTRLADVFGLEPYRHITAVYLNEVPLQLPRSARPQVFSPRHSSTRTSSRLVNGDCLAELRRLPDNSVEFCFADPPYNLSKRYDSWDDALDITRYFNWCDEWLDELARVLQPRCTCAVLNIPLWAIRHFQHLKDRLSFQNWIVWEGLGLPVRMIMPAHYSILCFSKGEPRPLPGLVRSKHTHLEAAALLALREGFCIRQSCIRVRGRLRQPDHEPISDLWWDVHRLKHNSRRVDHPCQLPPALMRRLIALFTSQGETVLDPFNGAGTTTLCAAALGRRFIGIEMSQTYHALADERHAVLQQGGDPFEKVSHVPKSKNSRVERIGQMQYKVSKKTLQLEVKLIAGRLGRLPTRDDVAKHSRYPISYFDDYFISWGEVCAAARTTGMTETRKPKQPQTQWDQQRLL